MHKIKVKYVPSTVYYVWQNNKKVIGVF